MNYKDSMHFQREKVPFKKLLAFILISFCFCACKQNSTPSKVNQYTLAEAKIEYQKFTKQIEEEDSTFLELIAPYRDSMSKEMDQVIAMNAENLNKRKPNSNLGNWMTDLLKEESEILFETEIDFAIQNYGGIRIPTLAQGEITKGDIFELMPFDNMLVLLKMPGTTVKQLCDRIADYGGWPISDGLSFTITDTIANDILVNGQALDLDKSYNVAMPDYIANGGDACHFLKDVERENSGVFIRQVLIQNIVRNHEEEGKPIEASSVDRIKT